MAVLNDKGLGDGLEVLRAHLGTKDIASLIERTARWVSAETFALLPIWFPEHARGVHFYKANWSTPQENTNRKTLQTVHKKEGNIHANKALTLALGLRSKERPNWSCCHIWGIDDPTYQTGNHLISDNRYFSCIANMVLLPTPLKAFTDVMPDVKAMLRWCSLQTFGWQPTHSDLIAYQNGLESSIKWDCYPASWPKYRKERIPAGTVPLNDRIRKSAIQRMQRIKDDLRNAGDFYPKKQVEAALAEFQIKL